MLASKLMSRNMIESNGRIFSMLDAYCANRSQPIRNSGLPRWIKTNSRDRDILKNVELGAQLSFSANRRLARFDYRQNVFICLVGFEYADPVLGLLEEDVQPGLLTAILSELKPQPNVPASSVIDIVDATDGNADTEYSGHTAPAIASLYPRIRAFVGKNFANENTWRVFFLLSIEECRAGESWIDERFSAALEELGQLCFLNVPYQTLCRSMFDSDPATMFLALYRCIEALYAYASAQVLIDALKLDVSWPELAASLEDKIGWYPREENSLTALMKFTRAQDLIEIFLSLGEIRPPPDADLPQSVAKRIYLLRNSLVHFRPALQKMDHDKIDWNRLCETMAHLVSSVYGEIFKSAGPPDSAQTEFAFVRDGSARPPIKAKATERHPNTPMSGGFIDRIKRLIRAT